MPGLAFPDYKTEEEFCRRFLEKSDAITTDGQPKYKQMLQEIADRRSVRLEIELEDLSSFDDNSTEYQIFVHNVARNVKRYIQMFASAADSVMPEADASSQKLRDADVIDVLIQQRLQRDMRSEGQKPDPLTLFPPALLRRFNVYFKSAGKEKSLPVRSIKAQHVGALLTVRGIVTRATEVKPVMQIATYTCDKCGYEIYQEVLSAKFTPLQKCPSSKCVQNSSNGRLFLQTRGSKFDKYQELRLQEMADEVPIGNIPRTITIKCFGETVRQAKPGDIVAISGVYLVTPYTGFRGVQAGLITDPYLEAMNITQLKRQYTDYNMTEEIADKITELANDAQVYNKLSQSIAPEIYGHEDIKKALLLLLVGGATKQMEDGLRIRGDINICLMGDPGVAKSQLLKYITTVAPRGVYTTGKGSSGVGLTAALVRDPVTEEFVLEGGALVLADRGVCCIDEFDKMDEGDRTAIHEVMEQQTISISKAGITTTLNARTSILAAANPIFGRYNRNKSAAHNINLPSALLSRFDLLFLILDTPSLKDDLRLAAHVTYVHAHSTHPDLSFTPLDANLMRSYIAQARQFDPIIPSSLTDYITEIYLGMRQQHRQRFAQGGAYSTPAENAISASYITPRSLLSILRLSQSLARLRFSSEVAQADVDEAVRLIDMSKASLFASADSRQPKSDELAIHANVYQIIRDYHEQLTSLATDDNAMSTDDPRLGIAMPYDSLRERVLQRGFNEPQLLASLNYLEDCNVLMVTRDRTVVRLLMETR